MTEVSPAQRREAPGLLICAPAPVRVEEGGWLLDVKFAEGMARHVAEWPGPVFCVLRDQTLPIPFGAHYRAEDLPFSLIVLEPGEVPEPPPGVAVVFLSADMPDFPELTAAMTARNIPVVAALEYTLETRLQILRLDPGLSLPRRLRRLIWQLGFERRLRRGLRAARGLQFNGWPAREAYGALTASPHLYLDNRMSAGLMVTPEEEAARAAVLRSGAPLRLIHSGRLEPMKGAQDLLPVMAALEARGIPATLDIYGAGSLSGALREGLSAFGGRVRLHDPLDFRSGLVPVNRQQGDIFLSCHRQSDPSCSYIEAMGCGLSVAGYDNRMWSALQRDSGSGVVAPLGDPVALARAIALWHGDREALIRDGLTAAAYARRHSFEAEFAGRMAHLRRCAGVADPA